MQLFLVAELSLCMANIFRPCFELLSLTFVLHESLFFSTLVCLDDHEREIYFKTNFLNNFSAFPNMEMNK